MDFKNWDKVTINQILCNKDLDTKNLVKLQVPEDAGNWTQL